MMRINQADRLSIWSEIFPKTCVLLIKISTVFPVKALTAGIDVIAAIRSTKIKVAFALTEWGRSEIENIPAIGKNKDKKSNKELVIDIWDIC